MRISVDRLDVQSLGLDLEQTGRVDVASAAALRGIIHRTDERLALEEFSAEHVALRSLRLMLGSLGLTSEVGGAIVGLALAFDQRAERIEVAVGAVTLAAEDLRIEVEGVAIQGKPTLSGVRLAIHPDGGSLSADRVEVTDLVVRVGELEIQAAAFRASKMRIGWGGSGFELAAETLDAPGLRASSGAVAIDAGPLGLNEILVGPEASGATAVRIARATMERGTVSATLSPSQDGEPDAAAVEARPPILDWCVLDFLSGKIDVDALVDVSVPILGRRRATHAFRVPIQSGTIDYRELEANLATLEDAVLDFAVRDGALVIERVNPLLPMRGHGRPIVGWTLDERDLELAERNRVRLSVLPTAKAVASASEAPPPSESGKSSGFALRALGLHRIDASLSLAPVEASCVGQLRPTKIGGLAIEGQLVHTPDESSPEGRVVGHASDVALTVAGLDVSTQSLDVSRASIAKVVSFDVAFADIVPTAAKIELEGAVVEDLSLGSSPRGHRRVA